MNNSLIGKRLKLELNEHEIIGNCVLLDTSRNVLLLENKDVVEFVKIDAITSFEIISDSVVKSLDLSLPSDEQINERISAELLKRKSLEDVPLLQQVLII